ncbi:hypothetical protein DPMN_018492 [Dreissena polymorpha]|uniref:Uncharacterized protein n=1 Tax=Dreissena polymorpha TaxID=45954 RepID=A0A9D4NGN8_DREPO|nr:hypothetical protein DPMN_086072 [Dreissena polymorpha]KAH3894336.1 hypothetical protein DPMN_018492 [Dreissena polymorpha]
MVWTRAFGLLGPRTPFCHIISISWSLPVQATDDGPDTCRLKLCAIFALQG